MMKFIAFLLVILVILTGIKIYKDYQENKTDTIDEIRDKWTLYTNNSEQKVQIFEESECIWYDEKQQFWCLKNS